MSWTYVVGFLATAFTTAANLPQFIKCWRARDTQALSRKALIALALGLSLWVGYGVMRDDVLVAIGNLIALTITLALLSLKAKFG